MKRTNNYSKVICVSKLTASLVLAAPLVNAATVTVDDIRPSTVTTGDVTATSSTGTLSTETGSTLPNNNGGNPATHPALTNSTTYSLKLTNMTIDGTAGVDLTWDLTVSAGTGTGIVLQASTWTVESNGPPSFDIEAFRVNSGETATFLIDNVNATAPGGYVVDSASFAGFTGASYDQGTGIFNTGTGVVSHNGSGDFRITGVDAEFAVTISAVPEPSSAALLGLGGLALIMRRRK